MICDLRDLVNDGAALFSARQNALVMHKHAKARIEKLKPANQAVHP
jgi:hypothetical protein